LRGLLLKLLNGGGGWGFVCRFTDRETGEARQLVTENTKHPQPDSLMDAEIKTMLRDCVNGDALGVGMVVGMVDEHGSVTRASEPDLTIRQPQGISDRCWPSSGQGEA
jgi:hypothetical protein